MDLAAKAHKGEVGLEIGGKPYVLSFTYGQQEDLQAETGKSYDKYLSDAAEAEDVRAISLLLEFATNGAIGRNEIFAISPPIAVVVAALRNLRLMVYYGALEVPETNPIPRTGLGRWLVKMVAKLL